MSERARRRGVVRAPEGRAPSDSTQMRRPTADAPRPRPRARTRAVSTPSAPRGPVGATDLRHGRASEAVYRRRRLVALGGVLLLVVIVLVGAFGWPGFARSGTGPAPTTAATPTVTTPPPAPTPTPVERVDPTEFGAALPTTVLDYALVAQEPETTLADAGALESYTLTYTNGTDAAATSVAVLAGQWPTTLEVTTSAEDIVATLALPVVDTGDVLVADETAGTYSVVDPGDGTLTIVWTNNTALLWMAGPADAVRALYDAFPL